MNKNYRGIEKTDEFVNPYNFVSLKKQCSKTVDVFDKIKKGELSGTISCTLETLTPLFVPNTTTNQAFPFSNTVTNSRGERKTTTGNAYDFFSYENLVNEKDCTGRYAKPIIPGSSIRGVIRSAFEAVTNSCLSTCDDEDLVLHRRTTIPKAPKKERDGNYPAGYGILKKSKTGYTLYNAKKVMLNTARYHGQRHDYGVEVLRTGDSVKINGVNKKTGDIVYIKRKDKIFITSNGHPTDLYGVACISDKPEAGYDPGILFLGEKFQNKHHDAVFIKGALFRDDDGSNYNRLFKVWNPYQIDSPGSYPNYITLSEIPVYYGTMGNNLYLAPACISKEVFDAKYSTLLGSYKPCSTAQEKICPACALFGLVSKNTDGSIASRVMFRDAIPIDFSENNAAEYFECPRQLPILGTPKISATEFYTQDYRGEYKVWNYDYGIRSNDNKPESFCPELRGRKFYWHGKSLTTCDEGEDRADLTTKIRAVKAGKKFSFRISFERLTPQELNTILWVLTFGDDSNHAHKLGHGKPVGYGSVKITINGVTELELNKDDLTIEAKEYKPNYEKAKINKDEISQYLILTDYKNAPNNVKYPNGIKNTDSGVYQWFSLNKGKMNNPEFDQVLDTPEEIVPRVSIQNTAIAAEFERINAERDAQPSALGPKDKQIKAALAHFRNFARKKTDDPQHLTILKAVPRENVNYEKAQEAIRRNG